MKSVEYFPPLGTRSSHRRILNGNLYSKYNRSFPTWSVVKDSFSETRPRTSVWCKSSFVEKRNFKHPSLFLIGDSHARGLGERLTGVVQTVVMPCDMLLALIYTAVRVLSEPRQIYNWNFL